MTEIIEGSAPPVSPDNVLPETQKVMDALREKGFEFDGDKPKEPEKLETPKEVVPEPPKEPEKQPEEEKQPERKPREPHMIPAWQAEVDKKRIAKEFEDKSATEKKELLDAIDGLKSEINNLKGTKQEKKEEIGDWIDNLVAEKGVDVDTSFLKGFADELLKRVPKPQGLPEDLPRTLEAVREMEVKAAKEREDIEYNSAFRNEVIPKLKEEYPQISEEEIAAVQEQLKKPYFSERFVTLSSGEVYELTKSSYKDLISPAGRRTVERGTKGASRGGKMLDYSNLTEEDYANMTPEERSEANKFLLNR